ncbi:MAG: hypothetical protein HY226_01970 [Candidatus Vogelbacteria bacterium]|nr:hypothetical protein [Candidatus Vogelbacteria bacterium]
MEWWMNAATMLAYVFLTVGVVFQIRTAYRRKSADDIEIVEIIGRSVAQILIMWKMIVVSDVWLLIGHTIITVVYFGYVVLVVKYKYYK